MNGFRKEFSTSTLVLIAVAIAINVGIGQLVIILKWPLYLDSLGTVLVAILAGPWAGAVTGFLANVVWTATGLFPQAMAWAIVAAIIGLMAGWFFRSNWFDAVWKRVVGGLLTGIVAALISAPITTYLFGGVTGTGTDAIVALFRGAGLNALNANLAQGLTIDPLDKMVTFLIVWSIVQDLPKRLKARYASE